MKLATISLMKSTNGVWNVSSFPKYENDITDCISFLAIAKVALDVELGCLEDESNEETQLLIDSVCTFFKNVPELELKIPFWRLWNTPRFQKYIKSLDTITE